MSKASTAQFAAVRADAPSLAVAEFQDQRVRDRTTPEVEAATGAKSGPLTSLRARLRADHMVRNSLYLIFSSGVQSALGFAFWVIMARLFSTDDVGRASSLISAVTVIAYLALLGLNTTVVRYLPTAPDQNTLITVGTLLVAGGGAAIGFLYVLATPLIAPRLSFIEHSPAMVAGFALLAAGAAVNLLTDSVFIASRKANLCAVTDGGVGGIFKVVAGVALAGTGTYGLFAASAGGFAASAAVSLVLIVIVLKRRPWLRDPIRTLKPLLRFSAASYLANILNLLPVLAVPLITLDRLGPRAAAYYFVAFQIATLLYSGAYAVGQAFLAEGSHTGVDRRELFRRSRRVLILLYLPACLLTMGVAHWALIVFGTRYSEHGTGSLMLLASAAIPIGACTWSWNVLRLTGRLLPLVASYGVYMFGICGLAWLLAPHGLTALSAAWPIGSMLAAIVATAAVVIAPREAPPRHRRAAPGRVPRLRASSSHQGRRGGLGSAQAPAEFDARRLAR
ncbi:MAG TPA: lipopolysaccharide biosynthesis protein [Streptosporangiaceae bacterium]|nr:lipopolysaccharide biosynthesis protein [Streptosporangiaceae bacterium]